MISGPLSDTVALVTGASSGIGEATARRFAAEGAAVALLARRRDRIDAIAAEIHEAGGRALSIECDVTDQAQAETSVHQVVDQLGRLDTVFNNAGVMLLGAIQDAPTSEWDRMIDTNVKGLLYVAHAALPYLLAAPGDSPRGVADIVSTSSVAGRTVRRGVGVYNMTKWGVNAFCESLRQEVTQRHVRVSLIEPGAVATELTDHLRPEIRELARQRLAKMELLQPEDVADAVAYIVTRPRHIAINELLIRPTEQRD
ncbi:MAG: SDR family NAD(P)-dependent oxidoreductase [Actinobacteria bacterium]|nr:SDR family NAD(P)-dependent oxidoreductase [Actinomycetota bacterium]